MVSSSDVLGTPLDWSCAYRIQAEEDFKAAAAVRRVPSVYVMLLQMTFEKIAKAAYWKTQRNPPRSRTISVPSSGSSASLDARVEGFDKAAVDRMVSLLFKLENANPAVVHKRWKRLGGLHDPQLEYPWEDGSTRNVKTPARDLQLAWDIVDPRGSLGPTLEKFARALLDRFDTVFP